MKMKNYIMISTKRGTQTITQPKQKPCEIAYLLLSEFKMSCIALRNHTNTHTQSKRIQKQEQWTESNCSSEKDQNRNQGELRYKEKEYFSCSQMNK